jgi:23S rRNA pseudouridine2605 synthase
LVKERLHKVLAHAGIASRRAAERMIREHRIRVNGTLVVELGTQVDPARDRIEVDGRPLARAEAAHLYVALNKPVGVVSTAHDPQGRPTVVDLVHSTRRLYPVGRLDIDSEGLVLLTDDGELTFRLTHARFGVEKEYHVQVQCGGDIGEPLVAQLHKGVMLEDGLARAVRANVVKSAGPSASVLRVVMLEGRQREVRRMLAALGCGVEGLQRVRIGPLVLGDLHTGQHRNLRPREIEALRAARGVSLRSLPFVIALDGPAASGKSSVGLGAANELGFRYFDTGLLYRVLTWLALAKGVDADDAARLAALIDELDIDVDPTGRVFRDHTDITDLLQQPAVDAAVSAVSAHSEVRKAMRPAQRALIRPPGLVMAGRDIGTVIVPEASLKIWLNASPEERARRRSLQTGEPYAQVLEGMRRRDAMDASREVAPMTPARDAVLIDTDRVQSADVVAQIVELARARGAARVTNRA